MWLVPKPYIFLLCRIIKIFKPKGMNLRINISFDWLKCQMAPLPSSKIVKWLSQTKYTLWGSLRRDLQKIGWDCMNYHVFQEEAFNLCSWQKKKKNKQTKSQKREKISWALHSFHDSKPFALLDTKPTFTAFQDKICTPLHSITHAPYQVISA